MKQITNEQLKQILEDHRKWINDEGGNRANLSHADLHGANLRGASLRYANLREADLRGADLSGADLYCANLRDANLSHANLRGADLSGAKLKNLPVELLRCHFCGLPDELTLELMRRDAWSHPDPKAFNEWARGGDCPYENGESRMHSFEVKRHLWKNGKPQMRDWDLMVALAKQLGIEIIKD